MNATEKLLYRELYKKSFYDFVKDFWPTCEPAKFEDGKIVQIFCETFQYMCRDWIGYENPDVILPNNVEDYEVIDIRKKKKNINITIPPRHSKSSIFNVFGPVWLWTFAPIKAVSISHKGGLATKMNSKRKAIVNSARFKELYPDIKIITDTAESLVDSRGGELYSQSRDAMTGYGGDIIINDDLVNAEQARKDKQEMSNAWHYYQNTMPSRINNINKCIIINIQQRLSRNDITGRIMNDENLRNSYIFVNFPALFSKATLFICPISGEVICFGKGAPLWPERFGDYSEIRNNVGESVFRTQYLQDPTASDDAPVKEEMIYEEDLPKCPSISQSKEIYASHDFPVKDKEKSDFLGSVLAYKVGSRLYIKDALEVKQAFNKSIEYVTTLEEKFPGIIQVVEDKANGAPILQQLSDKVAGLKTFQPGSQSKYQRLESATLYMNSGMNLEAGGNVVFVKDVFDKLSGTWKLSPALELLKNKLLAFPSVDHDDIVDAFSQLVLFCFMDKRFAVYGKSFNDSNMFKVTKEQYDYTNVFVYKDRDVWKVSEIAIKYDIISKLIVTREQMFIANFDEGLRKLKEFAPDKNVFIDCSLDESLSGIFNDQLSIERYTYGIDFDKSVSNLNLGFSRKQVLLDTSCILTKADIDNFKYDKTHADELKFRTHADGFVANIRVAVKFYGNII